MLTTRRTRTQTHGKGLWLEHGCDWHAWLGIHSGTGLVSIARDLEWCEYLRWWGELADGRLVRWCLDHVDLYDYEPVPKTREYPRLPYPEARLADTTYAERDRPDWSVLVRLARNARRTLNGVLVLNWLRNTTATRVPILLAVLDARPFAL